MDENQQMAFHHYTNSGFIYATDTYLHYPPQCYSHAHLHYHYSPPPPPPPPPSMHHHEDCAYWPMYMSYYRFGASIPGNNCVYDVDNQLSRMEINGRAWEYASATTVVNIEDTVLTEAVPCEDNTATIMLPIPEECTGNPQEDAEEASDGSEVDWQDDIDPDNMTYEELLDLGETVGTQSRGLSQETIDLLPKSKYKSTGIFTRRRSAERCVICQMRYKRGEHLIHLPCKHIYHTDCGSTWLKINKACPICNGEVLSDQVKH